MSAGASRRIGDEPHPQGVPLGVDGDGAAPDRRAGPPEMPVCPSTAAVAGCEPSVGRTQRPARRLEVRLARDPSQQGVPR